MLVQMDIEAIRFIHAQDFPTTLHASNLGPYFGGGRHIKGQVENFTRRGIRLEESAVKKSD
jgi:hypothetical protein